LKFSPQTTSSEWVKLSVVKGISTVAVHPSATARASDDQHTVPSPVEVISIGTALLFHDETIVLGYPGDLSGRRKRTDGSWFDHGYDSTSRFRVIASETPESSQMDPIRNTRLIDRV